MKQGYFGNGFLAGWILGLMFTVFFTTYLRDRGRDECDNKLPRTEKCVQVWVPPEQGEKQ